MPAGPQRFFDVPISHGGALPDGVSCELLALEAQDGTRLSASLYLRSTMRPATALLFTHPAADFLQHYALGPLAGMGFAAIGVNTRYAGNESALLMENAALDLGAAVGYARQRFEHVVLVGNSGGGALSCFYQRQAEAPSVTSTPAGDPPDLTRAGLAPADALILLNAHPGRAHALVDWLDPSVVDERDAFAVDTGLDMFDARNGPPYAPEFVVRYRSAQLERNRRITSWVWARLAELEERGNQGTDLAFVVYRTAADLRFLDLSLDSSERAVGTYWGDARAANYQAAGFGRFTTLRCWLSQWGIDTSQALADRNLAECGVPLLMIQGTADQGVFNSDVQRVYDAATMPDRQIQWLKGANHFFVGQPQLASEMYGRVADWLEEREMGAR